jgi:hypothetical protein
LLAHENGSRHIGQDFKCLRNQFEAFALVPPVGAQSRLHGRPQSMPIKC